MPFKHNAARHHHIRQAEGFARSVLRLLGAEVAVPDHSTLSVRGRGFAGCQPRAICHDRPVHVRAGQRGPADLPGKASGMPRSMAANQGGAASCIMAVDAETGEIVAHVLTDNDAGDITQVPVLLATVEGRIASVIADGAYDGEVVYKETVARQHDPPAEVVIPPRSSSVVTAGNDCQTMRDRRVQLIAETGRMAWQKATGCGRRSLVETAIGRYKGSVANLAGAGRNTLERGEQQGHVRLQGASL